MLAEDVRHSNAANTAQNLFLYGLVTIENLKPNFSHLLLVLVPCDTDDPVVCSDFRYNEGNSWHRVESWTGDVCEGYIGNRY